MVKRIYMLLGALVTLCIISIGVYAGSEARAFSNSFQDLPQTSVVTSEIASVDLAKREALLAKWDVSTTKHPGWHHIVTKVDRPDGSGFSIKDVTIPDDFVRELYIETNESGLIIEIIQYMKTLEGEVVQFSYSKDGVTRNYTLNEEFPFSPYPFRWTSTINPLEIISILEREYFIDEENVIELTYEIPSNNIVLDAHKDTPIRTIYKKEVFEKETGKPMSRETLFIAENGDVIITDKAEILILESLDVLPNDVFNDIEEASSE